MQLIFNFDNGFFFECVFVLFYVYKVRMIRLKLLNVEVIIKWENKKLENGEQELEVKIIFKSEFVDKVD